MKTRNILIVIGIILLIILILNWKKIFGKKNGTTTGTGTMTGTRTITDTGTTGETQRSVIARRRINVSGNPSAKNGCQRGHGECCTNPSLPGCGEDVA